MQQLMMVLSTSYLLRPLIMLVILSVCAGIVGTVVNLRAGEFRAEAMVHAVFPGIVGGFVAGGTDSIAWGASVAALATAVALTTGAKNHNDVATAVVLTSFYSFGIVMSLYFADKSGQLEALMFGRVLEMSTARMWQSVVIAAMGAVLVAATWRDQIILAFDAASAKSLGVKVWRTDFALNLGIAAVVVAGAAVVGVLLVIGFVVVPAVTARLCARGPVSMAVIAALVAVAGSVLGFWAMLLETSRPISPQAAITLAMLAVFAVVVTATELRRAVK
ncbi:metal ABC transporter permease [Corynebacterium hindlerae]|uniref:Metal ABC transporter permease n=1 Tax=Corynebacterium hindlerae TaxID=699041 RepID=A0A7G5FHF0_9CORY|nr:metal ABC transporter permease [Corynebacterium hindlerae]QMV86041.1 metal ABC transporter permease [Corynebacterium hindlerae]